ncbi:hypothetical protein [Pontibacter mangrovi]|uniref:DUF4149 domain-containing protein n=1 Tax=Pontibacter mangrovi TaxID=2589816 RepID=A0A501WEU4_9BACT|nr:hypothetical protein [Pontibacter mangrovi]TPE44066.1 hypothetical protein FJM65_11655 [Pontibacter mangrovi]
MNYTSYLVLVTFVWAGFMSAISFMEAWLKFRAPGVTLHVGLSIGRLVFRGLNKVEWAFALVALALLLLGNGFGISPAFLLFASILILLLQTVWLLPAMDKRAESVMAGVQVSKSVLHFYYVGAELVKVILLISLGMQLL